MTTASYLALPPKLVRKGSDLSFEANIFEKDAPSDFLDFVFSLIVGFERGSISCSSFDLYSGTGDLTPNSSLVGNVLGQFVKGGGGGKAFSERNENLSSSKTLYDFLLSNLRESLLTGTGGLLGSGLVAFSSLTLRSLRLCEFVRNFSTFEVTAGNDRTVRVELSKDEQMSSNNCE